MGSLAYRVQTFRHSFFAEMFRLLWKDRPARVALMYVAFFVSLGILSFIWTPYDYRAQDLTAARQPPSWEHWFGTDLIGRDMFTRILYAGRITDILLVMTLFIGGLPISIFLGVSAGYFGGKVDAIIMFVGKIFNGIPALLFILLLTATMRPRYDVLLFSLGSPGEWVVRIGFADLMLIFVTTSMIFWIGGARLYRSLVLTLRSSPSVEGARMMGASNRRIILKHILPQLYPFIAHAAFGMIAGVVGIEIALSFFGIGIRPPHPSFGSMFSESASTQLLVSTPWLLLIPGVLVMLFFFAILFIELRLTVVLSSVYEREGN